MTAFIVYDEDSGFTPEEFAEVKQNLETLLSVKAGEMPLDRDFGIDDSDIIGMPINIAQNTYTLEVVEKVRRYEPRAEVTEVTFDFDEDGGIAAYVHFIRSDEEET